MNPASDEEVDQMLRKAGDAWRANRDENDEINPAWFDGSPRTIRISTTLAKAAASLVAVAVIAAALAVVLSRPSGQVGVAPPPVAIGSQQPSSTLASTSPAPSTKPSDLPTPSPDESSSAPSSSPTQMAPPWDVVSDGDRVSATGYLLENDRGAVSLCPSVVTFVTTGSPVGCSAIAKVGVIGVDVHSFPGEQRGATWLSTYLRVQGTWSGGAIQATGAEAVDKPLPAPWTVPCPTPAVGWPGNGTSGQQAAKQALLEDEVAAHLDDYASVWVGTIGSSHETAVVVGIAGNVATATKTLAAIYPYNLCLIGVPYSLQELQRVVDALRVGPVPWDIGVSPRIDRVSVTMAVLNQAAADALAPYADQIVLTITVVRSS